MRPVLPPLEATEPAPGGDAVRRFLFEGAAVRGQFVRLEESWRALREHQAYPAVVRDLLGEAVAAAVLLAATLKFHGSLTLQSSGEGAVRLLVAQCTHDFRVRALARFDETRVSGAAPAPGSEPPEQETERFRELLGPTGRFVVTVEEAGASEARYQGVVPLTGGSIAESLEGYFASSEQLPTRVQLAADAQHAAGLLVQRLPEGVPSPEPLGVAGAWAGAQRGLLAVERAELLSQPLERVLVRHFGRWDMRVFAGSAVRFECRCNPRRVVRVLRALGPEDVREVLAEQGAVTVTCDFCNQPYRFDAVDVEQLFAEGAASDAPSSMQ